MLVEALWAADPGKEEDDALRDARRQTHLKCDSRGKKTGHKKRRRKEIPWIFFSRRTSRPL